MNRCGSILFALLVLTIEAKVINQPAKGVPNGEDNNMSGKHVGIEGVMQIGCYHDSIDTPAFLNRKLLRKFGDTLNIVETCKGLAQEHHSTFFGIEFYGECWYGQSDTVLYDTNGPSDNCLEGLIGKEYTVMVYALEDW